MSPYRSCCEARPAEYRGTTMAELTDLAELVEPVDSRCYRCTRCGQLWREGYFPFMHAEVPVVYKDGRTPELHKPIST